MSGVSVVNMLDSYNHLGVMKGAPNLGADAECGEIRMDPNDGLRYRFTGHSWDLLPTSKDDYGNIIQWDGSTWLRAGSC